MLCKYGKQMRDFWAFLVLVSSNFLYFGGLVNKTIFPFALVVVLLKEKTHNTRIKLGEITTFKNETSTTNRSDLPVVVVISGAKNKN